MKGEGETESSSEGHDPIIYDFGAGRYPSHPSARTVDLDPGSGADIISNTENLDVVKSNTADLVTMIHSIEHVNPQRVLSEAFRILRPGGSVIVETPNAYNLVVIVRYLFRRAYSVDPHHIVTFGEVELRQLLQHAGFKSIIITHTHVRRRHRPSKSLLEAVIEKMAPAHLRPCLYATAFKPGPVGGSQPLRPVS